MLLLVTATRMVLNLEVTLLSCLSVIFCVQFYLITSNSREIFQLVWLIHHCHVFLVDWWDSSVSLLMAAFNQVLVCFLL